MNEQEKKGLYLLTPKFMIRTKLNKGKSHHLVSEITNSLKTAAIPLVP